LATDADTGEIAWYFQDIPNDQFDGDSTAQRILYDTTHPETGEAVKAVSNWGRLGYFYTLNRTNGEFISAVAQTDNINWTAGIDPKTGKPVEYDPNAGLQTYAVAGPRRGRPAEDAPLTCATFAGGPTGIWQASYDPTTGITYNTRDVGCYYQTLTRTVDEAFNPLEREGVGSQAQRIGVDSQLALIAIDTASGAVVNTVTRDLGISDGLLGQVGALATAGGLVFTGGQDGRILAYDKDTLEELWSFNVGVKTHGSMMSYAIGEKQYVAVIVGGASGPDIPVPAAGNTLIVWSLPN
jgi:alcohol dehydrogenase (cytochrome c)